jgi:hypothetical protein
MFRPLTWAPVVASLGAEQIKPETPTATRARSRPGRVLYRGNVRGGDRSGGQQADFVGRLGDLVVSKVPRTTPRGWLWHRTSYGPALGSLERHVNHAFADVDADADGGAVQQPTGWATVLPMCV